MRASASIVMLCSLSAFAACNVDSVPESRRQVAIEYPVGRVRVVSTDGSLIAELPRDEGDTGLITESFHAPYTNVDTGQIVAVRCTRDGECGLVAIEPNGKVGRTIYTSAHGSMIDGPAISPDGRTVATFEGRDIVLIDYETGVPRKRLEMVKAVEADPRGGLDDDELGWSVDGHACFALVAGGALDRSAKVAYVGPGLELTTAVGKIGATGEEGVSWTELPNGVCVHGRLLARLDSSESTAALFGSAEDPVCDVVGRSTGQYFYYAWTEGLFASGWIEGYDSSSGRRFKVKRLWRALYKE